MPPESGDSLRLLTATRVVVVAGKGGVGKTTVTAVIARAAARAGARVLAVELDGKPTLGDLLADTDVEVASLAASRALEDYLREHGFGRIAKRLNKSGIIDLMGTAAPGIDDVVVLGKIKQFERGGEYDLIVVDGPAAGHAVTFLTSATGLVEAIPGGPVHQQAAAVQQLLRDHERLQVVLVTLPETTPVNEAIETAAVLRDRVGVRLGPIVVNGLDDGPPLPDDAATGELLADVADEARQPLAAAAAFVRARRAMEATEVDRLRRQLVEPFGLGELWFPAQPTAGLAAADVARLADRLAGGSVGATVRPSQPAAPAATTATAATPAAPQDPTDRPAGLAGSADHAEPYPDAEAVRALAAEASAQRAPGRDRGVASVIEEASVIVCGGSGGVGKTTMAAVIGLEAARLGRRAVVVTIDPARRLADALGLPDGLTGTPQPIDLGGYGAATGTASVGELSAMMLDAPATFDALVRRHAEDEEQVERILANSLYRNMVGAMSGTQEYMAAEMLHELHGDERFDLVVVDTPPSRNALDFLEAPDVLARFLDHRLFKLLMLPTRGGLRLLGSAAQPMLKAIGRIVGSDVLADTVAFFQGFSGMEDGFRRRASEVVALIRAPETAFVVVASPRTDTIDEAVWFTRQLTDQGIDVSGAVVNRTHPGFGDGDLAGLPEATVAGSDGDEDGLAALVDNLRRLQQLRASELAVAAPLIDLVGAERTVTMALLRQDVHDLDGLCTIGDHLLR